MAQSFVAPIKSGPQDAAIRKAIAAAIAAIDQGRLDEAAAALSADGGAAIKTSVGQNILGDINLKQSRPEDALRAFEAAVKLAPKMPEAHCNRGAALQELGRFDDALSALDRALRYRPDYATAHFNRGNVLKALGRLGEAVAAYDRALRTQPNFAEAHLNRGLANLGLGRALEAVSDFGKASAARPNYAPALVGRAAALRDLGDLRQALAALDAVAALDPDTIDAALMRCSVLAAAERFEEALALADALLAGDPANARAHTERALALRKLGRLDEALAAADTAITAAPQDHEAYTARAVVLGDLGRLEESADALASAKQLGANGSVFNHTLAMVQLALGSLADAGASFERAIALRPNDPVNHYHRSFLLLSLGDFAAGWDEHEWRLKMREHGQAEMQALAPQWRGEGLTGRKLLVYSEQGLGDTIQFARYLKLAATPGGSITLVVQEPLRHLFETNFPGIDVTASLGMRKGFDFQIPLMSLAQAFSGAGETIPANVPYLSADPERVAKWRKRIGTDGFKIGIAWQGNPKYPGDRNRSIRLGEFAPLATVPGVRLVSLQAGFGAGQVRDVPFRVEELGEEIVNNPDGLREVAAAMIALDLMIMSDTGPTHLAGALGRPTFVALGDRPDWRWMHGRADSPWYPTMRLFRQTSRGDWPGVFAEIAKALCAAVERGSP